MNKGVDMIESGAMVRSWGWSVAIHVAAWGLGLWLISQQAMVQPSLVQWEVSLVSPSQQVSSDAPVSRASSQVDGRIRPVAQKSGGTPAAAAMPNPSDTDHPTAFPSSDPAAPHQAVEESQNAVADETRGLDVPNVQSVVAADQRTDGSLEPPAEVTEPSATVTQAHSIETAPDFGWLMQMLWSRVTELKHYPPEARMNRLEGRVVVRVVIDEQGRLLDATIATGSGHEVLDHAALDVIRRSCPLSLPQALGRRQIVLRVPIQYRLDS